MSIQNPSIGSSTPSQLNPRYTNINNNHDDVDRLVDTIVAQGVGENITAASSSAEGGEALATTVPATTAAVTKKRSPADFLKAVLGRSVKVRLNSGTEYRGVLACLDGYLNIAMEQTEEFVDGHLKAKYGDCFIRGNNVLYISTVPRRK